MPVIAEYFIQCPLYISCYKFVFVSHANTHERARARRPIGMANLFIGHVVSSIGYSTLALIDFYYVQHSNVYTTPKRILGVTCVAFQLNSMVALAYMALFACRILLQAISFLNCLSAVCGQCRKTKALHIRLERFVLSLGRLDETLPARLCFTLPNGVAFIHV